MSGTHTVISNKISMLFGSEISLKDFSFSQLTVAVKNLFDTEGVPGFVKALVILIESLLIKSGVDCPHCGKDKHHLHSKSDRKLKTSIGEVNLALTRLLCLSCKKTINPMAQLFELDKYSCKSGEFEKFALETVTDQRSFVSLIVDYDNKKIFEAIEGKTAQGLTVNLHHVPGQRSGS